jgi:hypothetical protein
MNDMKTFEIEYHDEIIRVLAEDNYTLSYPDGRWLILEKKSDDAPVWLVKNKSKGPDWMNREQAQVIGELLHRKEMELENSTHA